MGFNSEVNERTHARIHPLSLLLLTLDLKRAGERSVRSLGVPSGMSTARQLPDVSLSSRWRINPFTLHTHAHGRTNTRTDTDVYTFSHSTAFSLSLAFPSFVYFFFILFHSRCRRPQAVVYNRAKGGKMRFAFARSSSSFSLSFSPAALLQARFPADAPGHTAIAEGRGFAHDSPPRPASQPCVVHR